MTKQCSSCGGFCGKVCQRENVKPKLQRTWVGLTDDELLFLHGYDSELYDLIKVVETKLKEKNEEK